MLHIRLFWEAATGSSLCNSTPCAQKKVGRQPLPGKQAWKLRVNHATKQVHALAAEAHRSSLFKECGGGEWTALANAATSLLHTILGMELVSELIIPQARRVTLSECDAGRESELVSPMQASSARPLALGCGERKESLLHPRVPR